MKIAVWSTQRVQIEKSPYIVLNVNPQSNNEINNFGSYVLCECDFDSSSQDGMSFLNSAANKVSYESTWVQEAIHMFFCRKCHHVVITNSNHNVKNNRYHNLGGSCPEVMGGYIFDPVLFHLAGVSENLCRP